MNKRILDLAIKSGHIVSDLPLNANEKIQLAGLEKFAELIVQECCQAFETEVDTWKQMDPYQGGMKRAGTKAIKQHFGVK